MKNYTTKILNYISVNKKLLAVIRIMRTHSKIAHEKALSGSSTEMKEFARADRNETGIVGATL